MRPRIAALLVVALVLAATLTPTAEPDAKLWSRCILCGERGLSDALANVLLFLPIGVSFGIWRRSSPRGALGLAVLLTCGVELLQIVVPGRDPSPSDVLFNILGAGLGIAVVTSARAWLYPSRAAAATLTLATALLAAGALLLPAHLLAPALPHSVYFGQWTPDLGQFERYEGRVLSARLGAMEVPPWELDDPGLTRDLLLRRAPLEVRVTAGPLPAATAPILSIFDELQREVFLLGASGLDLVVRYATRASAWRLASPELRARGALAGVAPGSEIRVSLRGDRLGGYCVGVDGAERCGLRYTPLDGWAMLHLPAGVSEGVWRLLGSVWIALWLVPMGFWGRGRPELAAGILVVVNALGLLAPAVGLGPVPLEGVFAGAMGVGIGAGLRRYAVVRLARRARGTGPRVLAQPPVRYAATQQPWEARGVLPPRTRS